MKKARKPLLSSAELAQIKQTLDERDYDLVSEVGAGAFAHVFKVFSRQYSDYFAAKVFPIGSPTLAKNITSFTTEYGALSKIYHPNVINVYAQFSDTNNLYIILDFCPGGSVMDIIKNRTVLNEEQILFWLFQIANALQTCHDFGYAHRDVKPANILLDYQGRPKLADFGLSILTDPNVLSQRVAGSLSYSAPEVVKGHKYDPYKADVWSLGMTFYVISTFNLPFKAKTDQDLLQEISDPQIKYPDTMSPVIKDLISKMLVVYPEQRITISELLLDKAFSKFKKKKSIRSCQSFVKTTFADHSSLMKRSLLSVPPKKPNQNPHFSYTPISSSSLAAVIPKRVKPKLPVTPSFHFDIGN